VRSLPLRLTPVAGESLPGYVARYSHTFQFPPGDVITALGFNHNGQVTSAGRYGVTLSAAQLQHAAVATGISLQALEQMLLFRYAGVAFELTGAADPLGQAAQAHEVLIRSSKFCPGCLGDHGAWMLRWQLAWSAVCTHHRVLLARCCPVCGTVPKDVLRSRWIRDRHGPLSDPTRCTRRVGRELCRTDLARLETESVTNEAVQAQRRIDLLLDGGASPMLGGERLAPLVYLRCVHALCKLLAYYAPAQSGGQPDASELGRRVLDDPATAAVVLADALALADLTDRPALVDALRQLAERRYHQDGFTLRLATLRHVPDPLRDALGQALSETVWSLPLTRIGLHPRAHRRPGDLDARLGPQHVPQLLWAGDYRSQIAGLFDFDDFTHWLGRRLCSLLLARMLTPLDWDGAVRYLDFPEAFINKGYNTTTVKLRAIGRFDELIHRIKQTANHHAEQELIDYKQRRAGLADWVGIDPGTWQLLQPRLPTNCRWRADMPPRRARASVWLWCELTSGHERACPIALPTNNLAHQGEFIRDALPDLHERLMILAQLLLATPANARDTIPARLEATLRERAYPIFRPNPTSRREAGPRARHERPKPPRVPPDITERLLAHVAAHTGVDIPTLTTAKFPRMQTPPAVIHAHLLAAALLKRIWPTSWAAIGEAINQDGNEIADDQRAYQAALKRQPRLASELDHLHQTIQDPETATPSVPATPHPQRMRHVADQIQKRACELLAAAHGKHLTRHASIAACRNHTDLTCVTIAAVHGIRNAQPALSQAIVARHRRGDPQFDRRYQQLLADAERARRIAGFANANLQRGLTTQPNTKQPVPNSV